MHILINILSIFLLQVDHFDSDILNYLTAPEQVVEHAVPGNIFLEDCLIFSICPCRVVFRLEICVLFFTHQIL